MLVAYWISTNQSNSMAEEDAGFWSAWAKANQGLGSQLLLIYVCLEVEGHHQLMKLSSKQIWYESTGYYAY